MVASVRGKATSRTGGSLGSMRRISNEGCFTDLHDGQMYLVAEHSGRIKVSDGLLPFSHKILGGSRTPLCTMICLIIALEGPPFNPILAGFALMASNCVHCARLDKVGHCHEDAPKIVVSWAWTDGLRYRAVHSVLTTWALSLHILVLWPSRTANRSAQVAARISALTLVCFLPGTRPWASGHQLEGSSGWAATTPQPPPNRQGMCGDMSDLGKSHLQTSHKG